MKTNKKNNKFLFLLFFSIQCMHDKKGKKITKMKTAHDQVCKACAIDGS